MDPYTGKIKASANYPTFDPNLYKEEYKLKLLKYDDRKFIDNDTYYDIPVFILTGDSLKKSDFSERKDESYKKYIYKNLL
jgi:cell division protein FtsI/penicillin-binding protein 2